MAQLDILDKNGKSTGKVKIPAVISEQKVQPILIRQAALSYLAALRQSNAHTKTRGEIAGGGRKPWRQKGTGRARAGSTRSPLWIGGGITFGPRNDRNYTKKLPQKMRRVAFTMALQDKINDNRLIILHDLSLGKPKTKLMAELLSNLPSHGHTVLVVLSQSDPKIEVAAANISYTKTVNLNTLNLLDLLQFEYVAMTEKTFKILADTYAKDKTVAKTEPEAKPAPKTKPTADIADKKESA